MSKTSKIILVTIVATCILLGLGYAAIQNITLNVIGTVAADPNQANFKVGFVGTPVVSDGTYVSAGITNSTNATINVSGLTTKGQKVTATYNIKNDSKDLSSDLSVSATSSNTEYFVVSSRLNKSSLVAGEETTVVVTVELSKTLIEDSVSTNIGIELTAYPIEPGKEGTTEDTKDFSQTLHGKNEYGFYFNKLYTDKRGRDRISFIFYEDTSANMYINDMFVGYYAPGFWTYEENSIESGEEIPADRMEFVPSEDGTNLKSWLFESDLDYEFTEKFDRLDGRQNEYGFYYGEGYTYYDYNMNGISTCVTFVPYEDGSVEHYINDILIDSYPANTLIYNGNTIDTTILNLDILNVLDNGRVLANSEGEAAGLDPFFWDRVSIVEPDVNEYGFFYNYPYSIENDDEKITYIFREKGSFELYINEILTEYYPPNTLTYENNKIIADGLDILHVIENGEVLTDTNTVYFTYDKECMSKYTYYGRSINKYGFCYGRAYSFYDSDTNELETYIAYKDGSMDFYLDYELQYEYPAGTLIYKDGIIDATAIDKGVFSIDNDGRFLYSNKNEKIALDMDFFARYYNH